MKKLSVLTLLLGLASGAWQTSGEIALTKSTQVNDLAINNYGELWILSPSSILKIEDVNNEPRVVKEIQSGTLFTVFGDDVYLLVNNRIWICKSEEEIAHPIGFIFNNPAQMATSTINNEPIIIILEPNRLIFASENKILGSMNAIADRFALIPFADYLDDQTPIFTLTRNQIYSWTGGTFKNINAYMNKLIFSASDNVIDFSADKRGNIYVLFSDSIAMLDATGEYKGRIGVGNVPFGSRILINPTDNSIVLYDRIEKNLEFISGASKDAGDIVVLNKNRPNPVDNYTEIEFSINQPLDLAITIYNLIGEPVKVIAKDRYLKGTHRVIWRADDERGNLVPNGVYFYRLESKKGIAIRQLIVLR